MIVQPDKAMEKDDSGTDAALDDFGVDVHFLEALEDNPRDPTVGQGRGCFDGGGGNGHAA